MRAGRQQNSLAISHDLAAYFSLEKKTQKSQNLMMSVFCSNTLATFLLQNAGIYAFLEAQISTFFLSSNLCFWPHNLRMWHKFFSPVPTPKLLPST